MRGTSLTKLTLASVGVLVAVALVYRIPAVYNRLSWRLDAAQAYIRGVINPVSAPPTPQPLPATPLQAPFLEVRSPTATATLPPTATPAGPDPTPIPSPTPRPQAVSLPSPAWEKQDWNNCGPTTLSLYLRYYGWEGDQYAISDLLKPERGDRNVNVEELVFYARTRAGWLNTEFRVGGDLETLKQLLAAGIPVIVEEGFILETSYWPNDDRWSGHYLLLTGYDETSRTFTAQDSFIGADQQVTYDHLDASWQIFNRVFLLVYPPQLEETVKAILGPHWDIEYNRQQALQTAQAEIEQDPESAFAWFNLGSNLVFFERYTEAAQAYDEARNLGLPQRMLRYQFGPFFAYFHSGRNEELLTLTEYALQRTPNAEEALLWHGWGLYRQGDTGNALIDFRTALDVNPFYQDAQYALEFVNANP
jgi:tetratricopeptide (TPR) repeat protein